MISIENKGIFNMHVFADADRKQWMHNIFMIYEKMRNVCDGGTYHYNSDGIDIAVMKDVYAPGFFTDSLWFAHHISKLVGSKSLLEIGTGTGIISIYCASNGATVVATDINPIAVENAMLNIRNNGINNISVRKGNLYEPIERAETFDFIFWAHPFNNWDSPVEDMLLRSGMDYHYEGVRGYIANARMHLSPSGKLLLGTGDSADLKTIAKIADENGYSLGLLDSVIMPLEVNGNDLIKYMILEFVPIE